MDNDGCLAVGKCFFLLWCMQVVGRIGLAIEVQLNRSETNKKKNIRRDNHVEK